MVPNLVDYRRACRDFSWSRAREALSGLPGGAGVNIAHEAVDRHALGSRRDKVALRFLGKQGRVRDLSYGELAQETNRFANALSALGVGAGDRVFSLLGRVPELYVTALGTLKARSVFCPLFSSFGPEPIKTRLRRGDARVLVTTDTLYKKKIHELRGELPGLEHVLLVGDPSSSEPLRGTSRFSGVVDVANPDFSIPATDPEDMALLHFTSGTTGAPKAAVHVHDAVVAHNLTGRLALDFHEGDIFWCTADPGWVTGTSYGIFAPLSCGVTTIVDEAEFDVERWYGILESQKVSVWYTSPTAIRMLMRVGGEPARRFDLSAVRFAASVGEPLNPEAIVWAQDNLGLAFHDNWWQTETGGIMIANFAALPIVPGSMGRPLPGIEAAICHRRADGTVEVIEEADRDGELALRSGWPSMFRGYLHDEERYRACFSDGWYFTGDLARRDAAGLYWFVGRADDVIKSAGHLIGPFEVESALLEHPAVAEVAVIGKPDPVAMEIVKAFVALKEGYVENSKLLREILGHARRRLGSSVAPREIEFVAELPHTRSGKIVRRLLKARELGLPEGDTSTLESGA